MAKFANTKGLSKQEKFIIQGMVAESNSVEDIAKYLDREPELVQGFMEDLKPEEESVETQEAPVQEAPKTTHVINKTAKGNKGIVAMTPVMSERSDANRKGRGIHTAKNAGYTHKIHE